MSSSRIDLAAKYVRLASRMGPRRGFQLLWQRGHHQFVKPLQRSESRVPLPDGKGHVWLRPGTSDWPVFEQLFLHQEYDAAGTPQQQGIARRYADACASGIRPLIIDLGANTGLSSLFFAHRWPGATVVAIEPDERNFALLAKNVASCGNIEALHAAIWDHPTTLAIVDPSADAWKVSVSESVTSTTRVPAITVAEVLRRFGHSEIFIAKIDIEGAESALFRSHTEWVDNADLLIIEFHDWLYPGRCPSKNFLRAAMRVDREVLIHGENLFCFRLLA